jgi:hypothetical protein
MKTRTVVIGVIVLVLGIILVVAGAIGALGSVTIITNFTEPHSGEFVSTEIFLNSTSGLAVSSPATTGGIIPAQDLNSVNSTNLGTYAISPNSNAIGTQTYKQLVGDYYYVAFASTQPGTRIVTTALGSGVVRYGLLVLAGLACFVAGIIVAVVGWRQKSRPPEERQS